MRWHATYTLPDIFLFLFMLFDKVACNPHSVIYFFSFLMLFPVVWQGSVQPTCCVVYFLFSFPVWWGSMQPTCCLIYFFLFWFLFPIVWWDSMQSIYCIIYFFFKFLIPIVWWGSVYLYILLDFIRSVLGYNLQYYFYFVIFIIIWMI